MTGYHKREIPRGKFGEISKIEEELEELKDACEQEIEIMALCELADLYGAIEGFLEEHFQCHIDMDDIKKMSDVTRRAFEDGTRQARVPESD